VFLDYFFVNQAEVRAQVALRRAALISERDVIDQALGFAASSINVLGSANRSTFGGASSHQVSGNLNSGAGQQGKNIGMTISKTVAMPKASVAAPAPTEDSVGYSEDSYGTDAFEETAGEEQEEEEEGGGGGGGDEDEIEEEGEAAGRDSAEVDEEFDSRVEKERASLVSERPKHSAKSGTPCETKVMANLYFIFVCLFVFLFNETHVCISLCYVFFLGINARFTIVSDAVHSK